MSRRTIASLTDADPTMRASFERHEARRRRTLARFLAWLLAPLAARYEATRRALEDR